MKWYFVSKNPHRRKTSVSDFLLPEFNGWDDCGDGCYTDEMAISFQFVRERGAYATPRELSEML